MLIRCLHPRLVHGIVVTVVMQQKKSFVCIASDNRKNEPAVRFFSPRRVPWKPLHLACETMYRKALAALPTPERRVPVR